MKNINQSLQAYSNIREQYFGKVPTKLSLNDVKSEILNTYDELPLIEVAFILQLAEKDYNQSQLSQSKTVAAFMFAAPSPLRLNKHHH